MPRPLAVRAAVVATSTAAAALTVLLPALPATGVRPVATTPATSASIPAPTAVDTITAPVVPVGVAVPTAAVRASALANALSKIGSPYRWGSAGPRAFDCSGLAFWAYKQVGVTLPRSSRSMAAVGTPVARSQLQPGDLVFFYRPVSHVAIYVGNGQVVHASTSGQPVKIADLGAMPFTTARRL